MNNTITIVSCFQKNQQLISAERFLGFFFRLFIPYAIMVSFNVKVILRLRASKQRSGLNNSRVRGQTNITHKGFRFTISTILIDLIFLIFNSPEIFLSGFNYIERMIFKLNTSNGVIFNIFFDFSLLLSLSYSSVLIFVFLVFNRIFRKELFLVFRLKKLINIISPNYFNSTSNRIDIFN